MAVTFAAIATLAVVAGEGAVDANQYGRAIAIVVLAAFELTLIFPSLADRAMRPFVDFGTKLSSSLGAPDAAIVPAFLLGAATGFLWAPCAGPILGLILTGAALNERSCSSRVSEQVSGTGSCSRWSRVCCNEALSPCGRVDQAGPGCCGTDFRSCDCLGR